MKIGLAAFKVKDTTYDLNKIHAAIKDTDAEILIFPEAYLQGFCAMTFDLDHDLKIARDIDDHIFVELKELTQRYHKALVIPYFEKDGEDIYSSCAFIAYGEILYNYRRMSDGWKIKEAPKNYKEGDSSSSIIYKEREFKIALCGDMFTDTRPYKTSGILIWPIYVNFDIVTFERSKSEYIQKANEASKDVLIVNALDDDPIAHGGAFYIKDGKLEKCLPYDEEDILIIDI